MKRIIAALALMMLAGQSSFAQTDDYNDIDATTAEDVQSRTTNEELDTTLTEEPGYLEEQTNPSGDTLSGTVDSPASGTSTNNHSNNSPQYYFNNGDEQSVQSGATVEGAEAPVNESTTQVGPRGIDNRGSWNVTAGPALTLGLESDNVLYGVSGGYTFNLTPSLGLRTFADANFGTGEDASQYLDLGAAAKIGVGEFIGQQMSRAYILGDVSLANARNAETDDTESGIAVGAGAGYTVMRTQRTDIDVILRYSLMLTEVDGDLPSLLTARVGVNF